MKNLPRGELREKAEAIRRARKLARKKLQREGLLPMKPGWFQGLSEEAAPLAGAVSDPGNSPTRTRKLSAQDSAGLSSTAEIHGKQDQGAAAGGKDAGEGGSRELRCSIFPTRPLGS